MNIQEYARAADRKSLEKLLYSSFDGVLSLFNDQSISPIDYYPMAFVDSDCVSILMYCSNPKTFEEIGYHCKAAVKASANYKYGENRSKLLCNLGLVNLDYSEGTCQVVTNRFGFLLTLFPKEDAIRLMIRLSISIPVINQILVASLNNSVVIDDYFPPEYSRNTIIRRSTSIIHLIKDICVEFGLNNYSLIKSKSAPFDEQTNIDSYAVASSSKQESMAEVHPSTDNTDFMVDMNVCDVDDSIADPIQPISGSNDEPESMAHDQFEESHISSPFEEDHNLLLQISSFISDFYEIDKLSPIKYLFETLVNIIEDPNSNYLTQTIASVPLGYFVKYAKLDQLSLKECEFACLYSLIRLYELDMDLVVLNLSSKFTLEHFYSARESYHAHYASVSAKVIDRLGLSNFVSLCSRDLDSPSYRSELSVLYSSEANLYYRAIHSSIDSLSDEQILRLQQLLSQSRIIYPKDGLDIRYIPILEPISLESRGDISLYNRIINEVFVEGVPGIVLSLSNYEADWQENLIELLTLSYIVSPFRDVCDKDSDIIYMFGVSLMDRLNSSLDPDTQSFLDDVYCKITTLVPHEYNQVVLMNRVNLIVISNYLGYLGEVPMADLIRSDNADITRICLSMDRSSGKSAKYKSRLGISSSLSAVEKMDVIELKKVRLLTDSPRSRQNRYMNKLRYDYDDQ